MEEEDVGVGQDGRSPSAHHDGYALPLKLESSLSSASSTPHDEKGYVLILDNLRCDLSDSRTIRSLTLVYGLLSAPYECLLFLSSQES